MNWTPGDSHLSLHKRERDPHQGAYTKQERIWFPVDIVALIDELWTDCKKTNHFPVQTMSLYLSGFIKLNFARKYQTVKSELQNKILNLN